MQKAIQKQKNDNDNSLSFLGRRVLLNLFGLVNCSLLLLMLCCKKDCFYCCVGALCCSKFSVESSRVEALIWLCEEDLERILTTNGSAFLMF